MNGDAEQEQPGVSAKPDPSRKRAKATRGRGNQAYAIRTVEVAKSPTPEDAKHALGLRELEERVGDARDSFWSNDESLFEDVFEGAKDAQFARTDPDACQPDESYMLRQLLRKVGPIEFCRRTVDSGRYAPKKLLSAFGVKVPEFFEGADDEAFLSLLTLAFSRELSKRAKLIRYNSMDDAIELLRRSQNIMVITGAGISTSLGIPDFRSKNTGLYAQLEKMGLAVNDPQEVFDINIFKEDPTIFFSVAREILVKTTRYSPTHAFIAMLDRMGKLLTNYTQNIDNVEALAGIDPGRMIQCHGSFATATCIQCRYHCPGEDIAPEIHDKKIPRCPKCLKSLLRPDGGRVKRKRSTGGGGGSGSGASRKRRGGRYSDDTEDDDSDFDIPEAGIMKPDITFFGEDLPDAFGRRLTGHDRDKVDLVLVIGTSLKVTPVSEIVSWLPANVPQMCITLDPIQHMNFDIDLLGECDIVVSELCRRAGWPLKHQMVPDNQVVSVVQEQGFEHRHRFKQTNPPEKQPCQYTPTLTLGSD